MSEVLEKSKIIIANWHKEEESFGGQQTFFKSLSKILNARLLSYTVAENTIGYNLFQNAFRIVYRGYIIDSYLKWYEDLFKPQLIIKNSAVGGFIKLRTPQVIIFQDPYYSIFLKMFEQGQFLPNFEHYLACITLQKKTAKEGITIAVSNFMKEDMKKCEIKCDKVIEEGVDTEKFKPYDKEQLKKIHNLPLDKKIGLTVTKFIPQKGWNIMAKLINKFQDIHWIVIMTEKFGVKSKLKNVTLVEGVLPDLMPRFYNVSDFYISTSPVESFNLSACEAASCNIPIIVYKTGFAYNWWDKKLGIRVNEWKYEAFEDAVKKLVVHKFEPRKAIIERGFTLERMKREWKKFIENLINNK